MAVYYINSYDIVDAERYQEYGPKVYPILQRYGAEILASDTAPMVIEGLARKMNAIVKFPSEAAALNCYNDPEYQVVKAIRINSTTNCTMVLVKEFGT
ncbi:hypothetical protein D3C86_1714970 [compost metagenome]